MCPSWPPDLPCVPASLNLKGNRACQIYADDYERRVFLTLLAKHAKRHGWIVFTYVYFCADLIFSDYPFLGVTASFADLLRRSDLSGYSLEAVETRQPVRLELPPQCVSIAVDRGLLR